MQIQGGGEANPILNIGKAMPVAGGEGGEGGPKVPLY